MVHLFETVWLAILYAGTRAMYWFFLAMFMLGAAAILLTVFGLLAIPMLILLFIYLRQW